MGECMPGGILQAGSSASLFKIQSHVEPLSSVLAVGTTKNQKDSIRSPGEYTSQFRPQK